ncbi:MAG: hypothetical protein KDD63_25440 [Bacteroidetes bacterium]|nr:hypothetical protein [Bacteroidota bacterium]MCB0841774.1 hypothetical protein [Bacteroidota bacterium]MCB0855602.1 hypothetical protein [Bacteroidota bacterium]
MKIVEVQTGDRIPAKIEKLIFEDFLFIKKSGQFEFDWRKPDIEKVYKLFDSQTTDILGLLYIEDYPEELRLEIKLLEVQKELVGKNKRIEGIAGCLIAFACAEAFKKGYQGFVSLVPKTLLINHYQNKYGFAKYGRQLAIEGYQANQLIENYLEYE